MEDNKLDQFFKNKLAHSDKSPTGAEWEAMRALLKEDKRRKPIFWWMVGSGILLLLVAMIFTWKYAFDDLETIEKSHKLNRQETEINQKNSNDRYASDNKLNIDKTNTEPNDKDLRSAVVPKNNHQDRKGSTPNGIGEVPAPAAVSKNIDVVQVADTVSQQSTYHQRQFETEGLRQVNISKRIPSLSLHIINVPGNISSLPKEEQELFKTPKRLPVRYAWSGMLMINPTPGQSPLQGMQLGFNVEKPINDHWYVGASPSFHMRVNEQGFSKFESFTSFGFSAREETYGLQANSLQFLRTPIYLGRSFQRHHLEMGVAVDLLLGARGTLREVAVVDQDVQVVQSLNSGWIETGDMKHLSAELFLGYKYQVNRSLKTGLSLFYNPGKLYPGLPDKRGQLYRKWYMGMQVIYYVK